MTLEPILSILKYFFLFFLILLPFLYDLNRKFRYYFKFFVCYWLFVLVNFVVAPIAIWSWVPICGSNVSILSILHRAIGYILNIRWKVIDEKASNVDQPCIVVANQQNLVDILGVYNTFTASRKNTIIRFQRHHDYFSYFIWLISIGTPILTCTKKDCEAVVYSTIMKELKIKKANIWIFCENIEELDTEIFNVAFQEDIPVIPLILSYYYFINSHEKIFDPGYVFIKVLPQLTLTRDNLVDEKFDIIQNMKLVLSNEYRTLSQKVTPPTLEALWQSYG